MKITIAGNTFEGDNIEINGSHVKKGEILSMQANIDGVDVEFERNTCVNHPEYDRGFRDGQQSKKAEIDAIKSKLSDIYDASDENTNVAHLLDEIQELLK